MASRVALVAIQHALRSLDSPPLLLSALSPSQLHTEPNMLARRLSTAAGALSSPHSSCDACRPPKRAGRRELHRSATCCTAWLAPGYRKLALHVPWSLEHSERRWEQALKRRGAARAALDEDEEENTDSMHFQQPHNDTDTLLYKSSTFRELVQRM